jgi:hypothetical protein
VLAPAPAAPTLDVTLRAPVLPARKWTARQLALPLTSLLAACGLLLITLAYTAARSEIAWADGLFWCGLVLLFGPLVIRLLSVDVSRSERLALVVLLGEGAYLLKITYSPLVLIFPDELQHWRTLNDILQSGSLFSFNPILEVSSLYPGLEIATDALISATGLPMLWAAVLIVGAARLLLALSLFLFYEQIGGSPRVAGLATMCYMANPNFIYLDGQFGYESLALALVALALYALARQRSASGRQVVGLMLVALVAVVAVVITHHFSQFVLAGVLAVWALVSLTLFGLRRHAFSPEERRIVLGEAARVGLIAAVCAAAAAAWLVRVAEPLIGYLGPNFTLGFVELFDLFSGQGGVRVPFSNGAGTHSALPEQVVGYLSVVCVLLALPFGLRIVWRRHRLDAAALTLAALAVAYPATLPLRLTPGGLATAGRLPEFLYFGVAFVVALVAASARPGAVPRRVWSGGVFSFVLMLLIGGTFTGWGPPGRLPGGYLVSADARSVDAQVLDTADFVRDVLGPRNIMAADLYNSLVLGSYAEQYMVSVSNSHQDASQVFFAPDLGLVQRQIIRQARIHYMLVDWRLTSGLPVSGVYYEHQEPDAFQHTRPMDAGAFQKFDTASNVSRVYDSGALTIYDVGGVSDAP